MDDTVPSTSTDSPTPVVASDDTTRSQRVGDWLRDDSRNPTIVGLVAACVGLLLACIWLDTRPPEQVVTIETVEVLVKASLVAVTAKHGDDLGTMGAKFDRTRIEMIGTNLDLIRRNTARCGIKVNGYCRRDTFGELTLAFDAILPGDVVYVIPKSDIDATPSTLTNTQP